jgi:hypothetical protein
MRKKQQLAYIKHIANEEVEPTHVPVGEGSSRVDPAWRKTTGSCVRHVCPLQLDLSFEVAVPLLSSTVL